MYFTQKWKQVLINPDTKFPIRSICYLHKKDQILASCLNDIFFLDPRDGTITNKKRNHQAAINCINCSYDGEFYSTGSTDGHLCIWRSADNYCLLSFCASSAIISIEWSPKQQYLIACSKNVYYNWNSCDTRATRHESKEDLDRILIGPTGDYCLFVYKSGIAEIRSLDMETVMKSFKFVSQFTTVMFVETNKQTYILTSDVECRIIMYRASDLKIVMKNTIPFEPICSLVSNTTSKYLIYGGVSGNVCILLPNLSFLCDFSTDSDLIWGMTLDKYGNIAVANKDGFVEMRSLELMVSSSLYKNMLLYRTGINTVIITSYGKRDSISIELQKMVATVAITKDYFAVIFSDSFQLFSYKLKKKLKISQKYEIPHKFDGSVVRMTSKYICCFYKRKMSIIDFSGKIIKIISFLSLISCASLEDEDGFYIVVGCVDGSIYQINMIEFKKVMIFKHSSSITLISKQFLNVAFIDSNNYFWQYNIIPKELKRKIQDITSFSFSDRIDELLAISDGEHIQIYYKDYNPIKIFNEGNILGFHLNTIILSSFSSYEIVTISFPLSEIIDREDWGSIKILSLLGFTKEEWKNILDASLQHKRYDIAKLAAQHVNFALSFYFNTTKEIEENEISEIILGKTPEKYPNHQSKNWREALEDSSNFDISSYEFPNEHLEEVIETLIAKDQTDIALKILQKSGNNELLAKTYVDLGKWIDAIMLSKTDESVCCLIYFKLGQKLLSDGLWFESLVSFFIPQEIEIRTKLFQNMTYYAIDSSDFKVLSFVSLMQGFNSPEDYWAHHEEALCYYSYERVIQYKDMPISLDEAIEIFQLCYYVRACTHQFELPALDHVQVLLMMLFASSVLGMKKWVVYSLREITSFKLDEKTKKAAQNYVQMCQSNEAQTHVVFNCPKCGFDAYSSTKYPLLICRNCGTKHTFSAHSCKLIPLIPFRYNGNKDPYSLIEHEQLPDEVHNDIPPDIANDEYLLKTPPEYIEMSKLREESCIEAKFWFNKERIEIHICSNCGTILNTEDFLNSVVENDCCPICYSTQDAVGIEIHSDTLDLFQHFKASSPISFQ